MRWRGLIIAGLIAGAVGNGFVGAWYASAQQQVTTWERIQRETKAAMERGDRAALDRIGKEEDSLRPRLEALWEQADAAANDGDEARADRLYLQAIRFAETTWGDAGSYLDDSHERRAAFHHSAEKYAEEVQIRRQALDRYLARHGPGYATMEKRFAIATALEAMERLPEAETELRAALADVAQDPNTLPQAKGMLGNYLARQKRYREAEPFLRQAGEHAGDEEWADTLEGLGRYAEAETYIRELYDEGGSRLPANISRQGRAADAAQVASRKLEEYRAGASRETLTAEQQMAQAVQSYRSVIPLLQEEIADLESEGRKEEARQSRQMLAFFEEEARNPTPPPVDWRGDVELPAEVARVGRLQMEAGNFKEAASNLAEACPAFRDRSVTNLRMSPAILRLYEHARAEGRVMSPGECFTFLTLARAGTELALGRAYGDDSFMAAQLAVETEAGQALSRAGAREFVTARGGGPILEQIDVHSQEVQALNEGWASLLATDGKGVRTKVVSTALPALLALSRRVKPHQIALHKLVGALRTRVPAYFELRTPDPVGIAALQARGGTDAALLKANEAVVLWMTAPGQERGLVFAISKDRLGWARMTLSGDDIRAKVRALRSQIDPCAYGARGSCAERGTKFDRITAWQLYQSLLGQEDIQKVVGPTSITKLLIVPSGPLTALPPALLVTEAPRDGERGDSAPDSLASTQWLIRKKAIAVLPSVSALRTLRVVLPAAQTRRDARTGIFMVADPDFSGRGEATGDCASTTRGRARSIASFFRDAASRKQALAGLERLPCTREEGIALRDLLGGVLLTGANARESAVRNASSQGRLAEASVVAFATHGLVAGELGLGEPALALAAPLAAESGDDGFLTATEVTRLRLAADWVLLSACNTASPDGTDAEGLSGLSRSFFFAGASGVLASHWRVDDVAAEALITKAVALHRSGSPKAEALRQASLAVLRGETGAADDSSSHPASWAAFTLIGEPD